MSLVKDVTAVILKRGNVSLDDLEDKFPESSREQIQKALENAKYQGLIRVVQRGHGGRRGAVTSIWGPVEAPKATGPRISSVWDLGAAQ